MDLGKIFTISQFNRNEQTTWLIDKFHRDFVTKERYDTVKLGWVFSIIDEDTIFPISLYIKEDVDNFEPPCKSRGYSRSVCGTTFSDIKKSYAGRGFDISKCKEDKYLNIMYEAFDKAREKGKDTFVALDAPLCFKAQSSYMHESDGFGRSFCYYIVGISIGEAFKNKHHK